MAATGALALVAITSKPAGAEATKSPWLAQTRISCGIPSKIAAAVATEPDPPAFVPSALRRGKPAPIVTVAWPNSRCGAGDDWGRLAVADAEHRMAEVEHRRVAFRRAGVRHAL